MVDTINTQEIEVEVVNIKFKNKKSKKLRYLSGWKATCYGTQQKVQKEINTIYIYIRILETQSLPPDLADSIYEKELTAAESNSKVLKMERMVSRV